MSKRLIVNADDYGRTPGVSRGILHAHVHGIVTSTTVLINQPDLDHQMADALGYPDLGVGLHLVSTSGQPVLPPDRVPGLVDAEGLFLSQRTQWASAADLPLDQLRSEWSAQIARFEDLAGRPPDHLDCHHFVHLFPPIFEVYADLAAEHRLPLRAPFPLDADLAQAAGTIPHLTGVPIDQVREMMAANVQALRARRLAHPDHFVGAFFGRPALTLDHLLGLLRGLEAGVTELMCHPGYDDAALAASTYRAEREIEIDLLSHPRVRAEIQALGIELIPFGALA
jgi:hypothetical protein